VRDEYFHQARLMTSTRSFPNASEKALHPALAPLRREALACSRHSPDPRQAEVIIETSEYIRCELDEAARREMVVKLEDFLRRRSKIALVVREEEIRGARVARRCRIFRRDAEAKIAEYMGTALTARSGWSRTYRFVGPARPISIALFPVLVKQRFQDSRTASAGSCGRNGGWHQLARCACCSRTTREAVRLVLEALLNKHRERAIEIGEPGPTKR